MSRPESGLDCSICATFARQCHPGVDLRANLKSIPHRCHLFAMAFVWKLTKDTIHLHLGCLQGGYHDLAVHVAAEVGGRQLEDLRLHLWLGIRI